MFGLSKDVGMEGRVLFVANLYRHFVAFHLPFIKLLQSWGYEVHAAAWTDGGGHKDDLEAAGVVCHDTRFVRSPVKPQNISAYRDVHRLLLSQEFDLIHVHTPMPAWLARLAAKRTGQRPVLYTAHGLHFYKGAPWPYWLFYYPAERIAARWTDGLIVMNREDFERAKRMGFVEGKNLFYVHGVGIELKRFCTRPTHIHPIRKELGLDAEDVAIACVAEFTSTKNHGFLLEAWRIAVERRASGQLLLVGDGRLRKVMERKVIKQSIPRVRFLGVRRDVPQILQASDILVLPSRREGLPRSIMEAMASGKPVVATDVRGARDLVDHGVTGFLTELGDTEGLAEALLRLMRDPALRERMGRAGREKIEAYSLDRVIQEMSAIYGRYLLPRNAIRAKTHGGKSRVPTGSRNNKAFG